MSSKKICIQSLVLNKSLIELVEFNNFQSAFLSIFCDDNLAPVEYVCAFVCMCQNSEVECNIAY